MRRALVLIVLLAGGRAQADGSDGSDEDAWKWSSSHGWENSGIDEVTRRSIEHQMRAAEEALQHVRDDPPRLPVVPPPHVHDPSAVAPFLLFGLGVFAILGVAVAAQASRKRDLDLAPAYDEPIASAPFAGTDVSVLRIALDARAGKFVETELARITKDTEVASPAGRSARLRDVSLMLRRVRDAWVYGGAVNEPLRELADARRAFTRHVQDTRSRMRADVAPSPLPSGRVDQTGLVLITIVVAAEGELASVNAIGAGESLRSALEAAAHRSDLVDLEVIVSPPTSSTELESRFPRPDLLPLASSTDGKLFCTYCGGVFPNELVTCPHCGGPAPGRQRGATA